jgi:hypothetical protein
MAIDNVVKFPKAYNGPEDQEAFAQKINTNIDMMKHYHIQETIATVTPMIFTQLEIAGFPLGDDESGELIDIKDGALVIEALRSIMCKQYDIYHPFQKIAENIFSPDEEEEGALKISDSINIELKQSEASEEEETSI